VTAWAQGGIAAEHAIRRVDAAADLSLSIQSNCPCDPATPVTLTLGATRSKTGVAGVPIALRVVRAPHIVPPDASDQAPRWGTTIVYSATLRTDSSGRAAVSLPVPADGLDSSYGIEATTRGASATTRIAVPHARIALAVEPVATRVDPGQPVAVDVRGFDASGGAPAAGLVAHLRLSHGSTVQAQDVTLDAGGRARAVFRNVSLGSNLILANADVAGRQVLDASAVSIEPRALSGAPPSDLGSVVIALDKARYHVGERITIRANAPGAGGDALITLDGARTYATRLGAASGGQVTATLDLGDPQGDVRVSAAFVRDGAIALGTARIQLDGPGHARTTELVLDRARYSPGETAHVSVRDGADRGGATYAIRVADGPESGSALFDDAPAVLSGGGTTSQNPASENPRWHAYVTPANSKASDIFAAEEARKAPTEPPSIAAAAPRTMLWRVERLAADNFDLAVPRERGRYVISVLKVADNGSVGASSIAFDVQ